MYPGWLALGSGDVTVGGLYTEIVNNARAYAYARNMGICWLQECEECDVTELALPGSGYKSPMLDPAPWFDPENSDTWGFLGVIGLDVQGEFTSTRAVTTKNAVTFGGVLGPPYFGPRTLVVRCLAIAVDECALTAGLEWLNFFAAMPSKPCLGDDLTFFDCCPCMCPDEPEPHCWPTDYDGLRDGPPCALDSWPSTYDELITGPPDPGADYVPDPTLLLSEPFDDLDAWVGKVGSPAVAPGGRRGTALQMTPGQQIRYLIPPASEDTTMTVGMAVKPTTLATTVSSPILFRSDNGATNHCALQWTPTGALQVVQASTVIAGPTAPGIMTVNEWHYLEVQVRLGNAPDGSVIVRHNDTEVLNVHGIDTRGGGTKVGFDTLMLTGPSILGNSTLFDDLYVKTGPDDSFEGNHTLPPGNPWCTWPQTYYGLPLGPPPCCVSTCVQPYVRQYYNAMVTAGPVILQHPSMHTQGAMAEFELTIVCANPAKHMLVPPFAPLPIPSSGGVIVSSAPDEVPVPDDPFDVPGQTTLKAIANVITRAAPPRPYTLPTEWRRSETELVTGGIGQMAPLLQVMAYGAQAEFVRVGLWRGDERVAGWLLPFIPAYSTVTIDVARREVRAERNDEERLLPGFVKNWNGGPVDFLELPHGTYRVTVDQEVDRAVRLLLRASSVAVA